MKPHNKSKQGEEELTVVAELGESALPETHPMVVVGHYLYVIDGKKLCRMYIPPETIWTKIARFFRNNFTRKTDYSSFV